MLWFPVQKGGGVLMQPSALWQQQWLGREPLQPSKGKSPHLRVQTFWSTTSKGHKFISQQYYLGQSFAPWSQSLDFQTTDSHLGGQLLLALVFYLVEDGKHTSSEFVLAPQYRASCTLHPAEDCCSNNGKRKGGRDELRARSTPMPKHTLHTFLLQWDMQVKPSWCSASLKTHSPASTSVQQTLTEQSHIILAKQLQEGKLEIFNKLLQRRLNIVSPPLMHSLPTAKPSQEVVQS